MSCLEFPKRRKVPQLLPQQGVKLETLSVAMARMRAAGF
jgi:hypothetical protein